MRSDKIDKGNKKNQIFDNMSPFLEKYINENNLQSEIDQILKNPKTAETNFFGRKSLCDLG